MALASSGRPSADGVASVVVDSECCSVGNEVPGPQPLGNKFGVWGRGCFCDSWASVVWCPDPTLLRNKFERA